MQHRRRHLHAVENTAKGSALPKQQEGSLRVRQGGQGLEEGWVGINAFGHCVGLAEFAEEGEGSIEQPIPIANGKYTLGRVQDQTNLSGCCSEAGQRCADVGDRAG